MTFIAPKTWAVGEVLSAVDMNLYVRDNTNALKEQIDTGFRFAGRRVYSPPGNYTFAKADPFGDGSLAGIEVRALRVICVGGGGAGGGGTGTGAGQASVAAGGSSGSYAESLFTDLSALPASVNVVVGAGGTGVIGATGNDGTNSSFAGVGASAFVVTGRAGRGGQRTPQATGLLSIQGTFRTLIPSTGQIVIEGGAGEGAMFDTAVIGPTSLLFGGTGGSNPLGSGGFGLTHVQGTTFGEPTGFGGGGAGVTITAGNTSAVAGINGGNGVVIVEVFI